MYFVLGKVKRRLIIYVNQVKIILKDFFLNFLASGVLCNNYLRIVIYRFFGNYVKKCYISPRCFLGPGRGKLHVGNASFINYNCWFDLGNDIIIGENVCIAMNVSFINGSHEIGGRERRDGKEITKPIVIEDGCWIGANSVIMPGVVIKSGTIIGAGSLVIKDCKKNAIYIGRPAEKLRDL